MSDMRQMQVGQIVDFCIAYNERQAKAEKRRNAPKRERAHKATQRDINAFFG